MAHAPREINVGPGANLSSTLRAFNHFNDQARVEPALAGSAGRADVFRGYLAGLQKVTTRDAVLEIANKNREFNEELTKCLELALKAKGLPEGAVLVLDQKGMPYGYAALKLGQAGTYEPIIEDQYLPGRLKKGLITVYLHENGPLAQKKWYPEYDGDVTRPENVAWLAKELGIEVGKDVFAGAPGTPLAYRGNSYFFVGGSCYLPEDQAKVLLRDLPQTPKVADPTEILAGWQEEGLVRDVHRIMLLRDRLRQTPTDLAIMS